jgi:hypothetical protein
MVGGRPAAPGLLVATSNTSFGWTAEMHGGAGNVVLSDSSVQPCSAMRLRQLLQPLGTRTNRFVIP